MTTVELLHEGEFNGCSRKTAERVLADLQRDKQVWSFAYPVGKKKLYTLTGRGARLEGLDERRFRHAPGLGAVRKHVSVLAFCVRSGNTLVRPGELPPPFEKVVACKGVNHSRYFVDFEPEQPRLSYIMPDHGSIHSRRIVKKVANELRRRKEHLPFKDLIYVKKLFSVTIITATEERRDEIARRLSHLTVAHAIVAVPEMTDFLLFEDE
jgi:hypothetical protein